MPIITTVHFATHFDTIATSPTIVLPCCVHLYSCSFFTIFETFLTRQGEANGGLDLARGERLALGVRDQLAGLAGDAVEDVVHERVHDRHGLLGDAGARMHLLEHLVDVHREGLGALLLLSARGGLLLGRGLLRRHGRVGGGWGGG